MNTQVLLPYLAMGYEDNVMTIIGHLYQKMRIHNKFIKHLHIGSTVLNQKPSIHLLPSDIKSL